MRAVVVIEWGPQRGSRAVIEPDARLQIGRFERADLVVPRDEALSGLHVALSWDGSRCALRDLGSANGTFVNGELVREAELGHGDWFRAGDTVFTLYFEANVPPWQPAATAPTFSREHKTSALSALRAEAAPLFAVLDAARDDRILTLLRASAETSRSLYEGAESEDLEEVAPYVVVLPRQSWLLEQLVEDGWGQGWGIYFTCSRPLAEVRRHLRRLLVVEMKETGELRYCRFYDPLVMTALIREANGRQRQVLFGEISAFLAEGEKGEVTRLGVSG